MFFEQKKLTDSEIEQKEVEFGDILVDLEKSAVLWKELRDFFANNPVKDYRFTYWRWFVELAWYRLNVLNKEDFSEVIAGQVPSALLQNYNVQDEIMQYLGLRTIDDAEMQSLYLKIQKSFLESEAVVGNWKEKEVTVIEVVKEINSVYEQGDSLAVADFESRLRQTMSPADEMAKKYLTADPEQAKERFLDLVSFFQTFTQENIWYVVDAFLNPEKYQNVAPGETPRTPPANPPQPTPARGGQASGESTKLVVPATIRPKPSLAQVKSEIEKEFKTEDVEGIMGKLNELAEKNNDPKIAEMYYYDESSGKFKWSI